MVGAHEHLQAVRDALQPLQLRDHDAGVVGGRRSGPIRLDQLRVAARDRDRRPQLVRHVADEVALARRRAVDVLEPVGALDVPDHDAEQDAHDRDLGELGDADLGRRARRSARRPS